MSETMEKRDLTVDAKDRGLIVVFTGEGKGKTSAALGTAMRAAGHGMRIFICFFMKGEYPYGERNTLNKIPNITVASFGQEEFVFPDRVKQVEIDQAKQALAACKEAVSSGKYDMVVMDEVNVAVAFNLISAEEVIEVLQNKPQELEIILTGRKADPKIIAIADMVTEMLKIKHPYDNGMAARKGIEF